MITHPSVPFQHLISTFKFVSFFKKLFIYLFLTVLGLCCRAGFSLVACAGFSLSWLLLFQRDINAYFVGVISKKLSTDVQANQSFQRKITKVMFP